jgi:hypothetical protein
MGEVLESLKINYGAYDVSALKTNGLFPLVGAPSGSFDFNTNITTLTPGVGTALSGINVVAATNTAAIVRDDIAAAYAQNIVAGICAELYYKVSDNATVKSKDVAAHIIVDANNGGYPINFLKYKVEMTSSGPTITDGSTQIYIRLEDFLEVLNRYVLLSDKKHRTPLAKLSVRERETNIPLLCLGNIHQISTNPHVCLIKNDAYLDPDTKLGVVGLNVTAVKTYLNEINSRFTYLSPTTEFGEIGNVFVNLDYLYGLALSDTLAEKDKKEKNDIIVFDYIKSMMSGINTAIGNVANFDIFIDPIDSVGRIIDVNYVDTTSRKDAHKNAFEIQVHNLKSTVRDYSLESQIFPEQSTMVAIGAQTKGGALGTNTSTLIDYNKGLVDRVIPQKEAPTTDSTASDTDRLFELQKSWAIIADLFIQLIPDWFSAGDYDVEESSKYSNALKDIINYFTSIGASNTKNRAIIPTKLSLTMDGIGGMVIGNMFKINDDILPSGYKGGTGPKDVGSKIGYIVTGLGHKVSNNDWTTQVDAQFVVLDEPTGTAGFPSVQAINRRVTAVSGSVGGTPDCLAKLKPLAFTTLRLIKPTNPDDDAIYKEILTGIGAPITDNNLLFFYAWRNAEGGVAAWNPFNTTYKLGTTTCYNSSAGVRNYQDRATGIQATVKTLLLSYYSGMLADLRSNTPSFQTATKHACTELTTWGTNVGINNVLAGTMTSVAPIARTTTIVKPCP